MRLATTFTRGSYHVRWAHGRTDNMLRSRLEGPGFGVRLILERYDASEALQGYTVRQLNLDLRVPG